MLGTLAQIPYVTAPEKTLVDHVPFIGPLKLQVFGPLVATGVILGWYRGLHFARKKGMDEWLVRDYMWWQLVFAFVMAHWVSVLFYFPEQVEEDPWVLLAFWNGLSSVGGFFGGLLGALWFCRKHEQPLVPYLDLSVYGLLLGWVFGRLGCSLVHDHPGKVADPDFLLAVGPWPDGTYRYDLGLYEWFFAVCLTAYVHLFTKPWTWRPGRLLGLVVVLYAPFRFAMDFLRAEAPSRGVTSVPDVRYLGLTTAQWFTIAFFLGGIYLLFLRKPRPEDEAFKRPDPPAPPEPMEQSDGGGDAQPAGPAGS